MAKIDPSQINFFSGEFKKNALPVYAELRKNNPLVPIKMPTGHTAWVFTRYDDCVNVLKDNRIFKNPANIPELKSTYEDVVQDEVISAIYTSMISEDPPEHTRLRSIAHKAFTPRRIASLEDDIQRISKELLDQAKEKKEFDLIQEYSFPLPIIVICKLLGVPDEDRDLFREWSKGFSENQNDPSKMAEMRKSIELAIEYMKDLFAERRKNPKDDLITALLQAEENGQKLSENELYSTVYLLIIAGHETTVNLIANGTVALLSHPDQWNQLKQNPDLLPTAIEEMLRFSGPAEITTDRWVGANFEMYGQQLKIGDMAIPVIRSANFDEQKFENPERFDITRNPNPHIAFGSGIHYCLGAPLARLESKVAFSHLIEYFPHMELAVDPSELENVDNLLFHAYKQVPVRV